MKCQAALGEFAGINKHMYSNVDLALFWWGQVHIIWFPRQGRPTWDILFCREDQYSQED
jgi:hypothetical protein